MKTVVLNNGTEVLAREGKWGMRAIGFGNRTAAYKKAAELGPGWVVYHWGVPFYVGKAPVKLGT